MTLPTNQTVIDLPFPPSVNSLFANVAKRGRIRSERYRAWANAAGWDLASQHPARVSGPVDLEFYIQEKRDRRRDLGNLEKAVTDLLVTHQVIDGDDYTVVRSIHLAWSQSVTGCRVCIRPAEAA